MPLTLLFCTVALATPQPVKLAAPGLSAVNVSPEVGAFFSEHLVQQLALRGLRVVSASEIGAILGLERQKQLLGCSEQSSSCMAELGNALGVDGLVIGSVGRFEGTYQLNVKVLSSTDARTLALYSAQAQGDKRVLEELNRAALSLARDVHRQLNRPMPKSDVPLEAPVPAARLERRPTGTRTAGTWMFLGGSAVLVGGVALAIAANGEGAGGTAGGAMVLVGLPVVLLGGVLYLAGGDEEVPITGAVMAGRGSVGLSVRGVLP